jgi:methionyl-tRNA formyltransferase
LLPITSSFLGKRSLFPRDFFRLVFSPKNVVYLGSDGIGIPALQWLWTHSGEAFRLVGVISGLDQKCGRGLQLRANPIVQWARTNGIPLLQTGCPKEEILPWMHHVEAEVGFVFAYGHILPQELLDGIPMGFLNLHASLLPELRGPSPIEGAILRRKSETGLSLMRLVKKMDAGPVYGTCAITIDEKETTVTLREKVAQAAVSALESYFIPALNGILLPVEQDHSRATYTKLIQKIDGLLDFRKSARELEAQVRAYVPWPGCFFYHDDLPVKVGRAEWRNGDGICSPGSVLGLSAGALEISAGDGVLRCLELQLPTKKMLPAATVIAHLGDLTIFSAMSDDRH